MENLWQNIVVILLVVGAVAYMAFYINKRRKAKSQCSQCQAGNSIPECSKLTKPDEKLHKL